MSDIVWQPSGAEVKSSQLWRFIEYVNTRHDLNIKEYQALYDWSLREPSLFWECVWLFNDIQSSQLYLRVFEPGETMASARWFTDSRLNFSENLLKYSDRLEKKHALVFYNETGRVFDLSYGDLRNQTAALQQAFKVYGVKPGDRIAAFMPNRPETIVAMLASAGLGAIWSSCSPDFGVQGVLERFSQIEPKILIVCDHYIYKGKHVDCRDKVRKLVAALPSVEKVIVIPYDRQAKAFDYVDFNDLITQGLGSRPIYKQLPFDHPLYIMYSSGTTGKPKCIVHGAGGTLLQHVKELALHTDLSEHDTFFYFTTCGWMMWNWMVSGLALGTTLVLYDGSPFHPHPGVLFDMVAREKISVFGTSAKYLSTLQKHDYAPNQHHRLSSLKAILSTGSPLLPESYDYVYDKIKTSLRLSSISGGTDIVSCFALGCPILPVRRGELQCRGLGMNVKVFNEQGLAVVSEKGELVCVAPFPSMPVYFWADEDGQRYRKAYFQRFENVWAHGDFAELTERGGFIIYGRSDAVLNPGGVRIGTAEIYRQVEKLPEVIESIAVGQEWQNDVRVILFVVLREGLTLDQKLIKMIRDGIRENVTARHVPAKVIQVAEIPRTISGKIVELAVRNIIHGRAVENSDALANPHALAYFKDLPELQERPKEPVAG